MGAEVPRAALVDAFKVGGCCVLIKVFVSFGRHLQCLFVFHIFYAMFLYFFMFSC